jgi:signal transduction histidine kinase
MLLRNAELTERLRERVRRESAQATELRASRQRVVSARDAARERLGREIQGAVCEPLERAEHDADRLREELRAGEDDITDDLADLTGRIDAAIKEFRAIVHGVFPPALTDHGLVAALENLVVGLRRDTTLTVRDVSRRQIPTRSAVRETTPAPPQERREGPQQHRHPGRVESGVYFCVATLLRDLAAEPASAPLAVEVRLAADALVVAVRDPAGVPVGPSVLEAVRDRVAALDGKLDLTSDGAGASITLRVPLGDVLPTTRDILPVTQEMPS